MPMLFHKKSIKKKKLIYTESLHCSLFRTWVGVSAEEKSLFQKMNRYKFKRRRGETPIVHISKSEAF